MNKPLLPREWIIRLSQFKMILVGFSGGLDSTVLLHALASLPELKKKLQAIHINHNISLNAKIWQDHCAGFCKQLGISFIAHSVVLDKNANLEERARKARYAVFSSLLNSDEALVLGHHQDDQAETLLLQLFRGAGVAGLAAMTNFCSFSEGTLVRPFLIYSRETLLHYANENQLKWIEDESNEDTSYSRNYIRQKVIPLLEERWPKVKHNLAQTAAHCQQAKLNLEELALKDCPNLESNKLLITFIKNLDFNRLSNVLRVWLQKNQVQCPSTQTFTRLISELIMAKEDAKPLISWGKIVIRRYQDCLYLEKKESAKKLTYIKWTDFPNPIVINQITLYAKKSTFGLKIPKEALIEIRFRQGGESFNWHGQTKQLKKLFQEWKVEPWLRDKVPLVYVNEQLAVVVGYGVSDSFYEEGKLQDKWIIG